MPGTAIGIKLPGPRKDVLHAEIIIREQDGRYTLTVNVMQPRPPEEPAPIVGELRKFLAVAVNKLNGK